LAAWLTTDWCAPRPQSCARGAQKLASDIAGCTQTVGANAQDGGEVIGVKAGTNNSAGVGWTSSDEGMGSKKELTMQIKILAFCGSSRRDSLNQKLLDTAVLGALESGAQATKNVCSISRCQFMTAIGKRNMDFPRARLRSRRCLQSITRF
jgi:hypothetical protein